MTDFAEVVIGTDIEKVSSAKLLGSLLLFTQVFYRLRTGRDFSIPLPAGRESHYITICRDLTSVFDGKIINELINIPPGHGKTELVIHFIAWAMAHYPDSAHLYVSYGKDQATKNTYKIKQIMMLPEYYDLFGVRIKRDSSAKDFFHTEQGGYVAAFGADSGITGHDAGLPYLDRYSGGLIIDDPHKPSEIHSDTMRKGIWDNYLETLMQRKRSPRVPTVIIAQRLHKTDMSGNLIAGLDGLQWNHLCLRAVDQAGNILAPHIITKERLMAMQDVNEFVYWSQYQQEPVAKGAGIFKTDRILEMDEEPDMLATFIISDTAETEKEYNCATVFTFFGIYKIKQGDLNTEMIGLHIIDCAELWVRPEELEDEFMSFFNKTLRYKCPPQVAIIEKKSTGVTLIGVLRKKVRGIEILEIERTVSSGSKIDRFLTAAPYVNGKYLSIRDDEPLIKKVKLHLDDINTEQTYEHDDICDTISDAIDGVYISKSIYHRLVKPTNSNEILNKAADFFAGQQRARGIAYDYNTNPTNGLDFSKNPFGGIKRKG